MEEKLERLYIATASSICTIYHRPTHQFIMSCDKKDLKRVLRDLLKMNTHKFYDYMEGEKVPLPNKKSFDNHVKDTDMIDKEKWYSGAWKNVTDTILKEYKLKMAYECIPYDYLESKEDKKGKGWGMSNNSHSDLEDLTEDKREDKKDNDIQELLDIFVKPKKTGNKKVVSKKSKAKEELKTETQTNKKNKVIRKKTTR